MMRRYQPLRRVVFSLINEKSVASSINGIPETQVTNYLAWSRKNFRKHVLATLRALAGSDDEFRADAAELLGAVPA